MGGFGRFSWRFVIRASLVAMLVLLAFPPGASAPVAQAQVKDLTGIYDVMEADSADPFVVEIVQTGNVVEGRFTRGDVGGTMSGSNSIVKLVGDWRGEDGSRGTFDMDIFPNAPRLEGLWRFEAPAPALRKHIWSQRLGAAPNVGGAPPAARATTGSPGAAPAAGTAPAVGGAPATQPAVEPAAAGTAAPSPSDLRPGPIFAVAANLAIATTRAAGDGDTADIRARLAQVKAAAPQTGLPFDTTLIDVALTSLDSGAGGAAVAPTLQAALVQFQQVADSR